MDQDEIYEQVSKLFGESAARNLVSSNNLSITQQPMLQTAASKTTKPEDLEQGPSPTKLSPSAMAFQDDRSGSLKMSKLEIDMAAMKDSPKTVNNLDHNLMNATTKGFGFKSPSGSDNILKKNMNVDKLPRIEANKETGLLDKESIKHGSVNPSSDSGSTNKHSHVQT